MSSVRKGQAPPKLSRQAFGERFRSLFLDPAYERASRELARIEEIAWDAYSNGRKAPRTQKAGPEFAHPNYDISVEWLATRARLQAAERRQKEPTAPSRVLLIIGAARNDGSCPGEISKTFRLSGLAREVLEQAQFQTDVLDLSLLTSDYGRRIFPCKGCVSTAMPLCHWPCSCYPNHSLNQVGDWMAEIYERWAAAHGVLIVTPVYWYQVPSALKLMIDRLVCADGGNPIRPPRRARTLRRRKRWSSPDGLIRNILQSAYTAWWCTAMLPASSRCGAHCLIGWIGWA
jgi:hypothetical protein